MKLEAAVQLAFDAMVNETKARILNLVETRQSKDSTFVKLEEEGVETPLSWWLICKDDDVVYRDNHPPAGWEEAILA